MMTLNKYSGSVKEELVLFDGLTAAVFGRADYYRSSWLPGAGADASLTLVDGLTLFGGVSYSYRTPTLQELYWTGIPSNIPRTAPWLKDEQHTVAEAGLRFSLFNTFSGSISIQTSRDCSSDFSSTPLFLPDVRTDIFAANFAGV